MISSIKTSKRETKLNLYLFNCLIGAIITATLLDSLIIKQIEALKVSITVPDLVKLNDAFWLNCSHQQNGQQQQHSLETFINNKKNGEDIYAIKWYKDDEEFYRYLPNAQPKVSIYETNGIQLDQTKSNEGNVFISKADVNTEGNYRCEILSEAPSFETVRKSKHLKVYALPIRGPRIEILDSNGRPKSLKAQEISYAVGDKIELRCNSAPSKPAARLRWYLNEHELVIPTNGSNNNSNGPQSSQGAVHYNSRRMQQRSSSSGAQLANNNQAAAALGYDVKVTPVEYRQHYKGIYSSHSTLSLVLQTDDLINNKISFKCLASMRQDIPIKSKQLILLMPPNSSRESGKASGNSSPLTSSLSSSSPSTDEIYSSTMFSRGRSARELSSGGLLSLLEPLISLGGSGGGDSSSVSAQHHPSRQRSQQHRHSVNRLSSSASSSSSSSSPSIPMQAKPLATQEQQGISAGSINELMSSQNEMLYIYEDSDTTLGPTIIDSFENLDSYLRSISNNNNDAFNNNENNNSINANGFQAYEFNRADNLEYIQALRDKLARQRSFPSTINSSNSLIGAGGGGGSSSSNYQKHFATNSNRIGHVGINSLVKSPLYLDENDLLRPIISWPPLEAGKLILLQPNNNIVAIPTITTILTTSALLTGSRRFNQNVSHSNNNNNNLQQQQQQQRFILPNNNRNNVEQPIRFDLFRSNKMNNDDVYKQILLERLLQNLNCTCTDSSIDTKLNWLINEIPLDQKDVKLYSPGRQNSLSLNINQLPTTTTSTNSNLNNNFHSTMVDNSPNNLKQTQSLSSLQNILKQYFNVVGSKMTTNSDPVSSASSGIFLSKQQHGINLNRATSSINNNDNDNQQVATDSQIKFVCQAIHSMLLYSSSEMITFDFNPPSLTQIDGNSIDKIAAPSNVILATSASQSSSSATGRFQYNILHNFTGSQTNHNTVTSFQTIFTTILLLGYLYTIASPQVYIHHTLSIR